MVSNTSASLQTQFPMIALGYRRKRCCYVNTLFPMIQLGYRLDVQWCRLQTQCTSISLLISYDFAMLLCPTTALGYRIDVQRFCKFSSAYICPMTLLRYRIAVQLFRNVTNSVSNDTLLVTGSVSDDSTRLQTMSNYSA